MPLDFEVFDSRPEPAEQGCTYCSEQYTAEPVFIAGVWYLDPFCHDICRREHKREEDEAFRDELRAAAGKESSVKREFDLVCPPLYAESELKRLPDENAYLSTLNWSEGPHGLILHGPSGTGKTRALWALIKKLMVQQRKQVKALTAEDLAIDISESFKDRSPQSYRLLMKELGSYPILAIDDLGKERLTARIEEALFKLIRDRADYNRPTLITTNFVGDDLVERFTDRNTAAPFVRRLREFNKAIHFRNGKQSRQGEIHLTDE